jgi:aspartyl-tRNA(Asn)/glutamyl-tRNA(Gln) amidotransferase subunit A
MTQQPALSVPCGFTTAGLPVGLHIVGARQTDALVLRVGQAYQAATDWHTRIPALLEEA